MVAMVKGSFPDCTVTVSGDGHHFDLTVVGEQFAGLSTLNRHRAINKVLADSITSGRLHAVNFHIFTPEEWRRAQSLAVSSG